MVGVESHEGVGSDFDGDGDVEEVHGTHWNGKSVLCTEFASGANGVTPVEFGVRPVAEADFLFEKADQFPGFACNDDSRPLKLTQRIEDFHALPRLPNDPSLSPAPTIKPRLTKR